MLNLNAVILDWETRSKCDLKKHAADNYARDITTEGLCLSIHELSNDNNWLWYPSKGPLPIHARKAIVNADIVMAHYARFDKLIWEFVGENEYDLPHIDPDKWYCTSAHARVNALPGDLDKASRAVDSKHRKNHKGTALIKKLSIPQADGEFIECAKSLLEMGEYCDDDVLATKGLVKATRLMTQIEHQDYLVNERINDRGVLVDFELANLATQYAADEQKEIGELLAEVTQGQVTKHTQHQRVKKWVLEEIAGTSTEQEIINLMTVWKKGEKKLSLAKDIRANILNMADANELEVSDDLYDVIALSDDGNKSSVAKFSRMVGMADFDDGRVRGAFIFAGAGQTKRYSSKGLQVHNFRRECFKPDETEALKDKMRTGEKLDNVMDTLSKLLRPAIIPAKGHDLVVGDWSAIEGRILPWLSDDVRSEGTLQVFENDEDIYVYTAESMSLDDRQVGKVATLSLGYQGALGAFNSMAKNYGLYLPESKVLRIVKSWRAANPWAVDFWKGLENAAKRAVKYPGTKQEVGLLTYFFTPSLLDGTLFCILPNGEAIQYPKARLEEQQTEYGTKVAVTYLKASYSPSADAKEWPRAALYGGLLAENATQATAAALLRHALREMDRYDNVVLHVHDEIVCEVPKEETEEMKNILQNVMETNPDWADGLPLKAEPEVMQRYGK